MGNAPSEVEKATALLEEIRAESMPLKAAEGLDHLNTLLALATKETRMKVLEIRGVETIVAAMTVFLYFPADVQEKGCRALSAFVSGQGPNAYDDLEFVSLFESWEKAMCNAGGIEAILAAMKTHLSTADVQAQGLITLLEVAYRDHDRLWSIIEAAVAAMRAHPGFFSVQEPGCQLLSMVSGEENTSRVVAAGGIEAVVTALRAHRSSVRIQSDACEALANIASAGNEAKIVAVGGIDAVVATMRVHPASEVVQQRGCMFLSSNCEDGTGHFAIWSSW
eukprot:TRINITY_DN9744_c0_g1_i2.p1 TRINITY_DN9744_c0_g1~~TRINITY_DN9744_c0_g1_i2.p1  ORF type:complete len:279 (-),score=11.11 TRINITY_DN9744_c0_g1_i2:220-1056(-)